MTDIKNNKEQIALILNKFPEVVWDRATGDIDGDFSCFGWIARDDYKFDYLDLYFIKGEVCSYSTSSAKYSKEFANRLGFAHEDCKRMEHIFKDVKVVMENSEKSDKIISIPVTYQYDKFQRIGRFEFLEGWFDKITPRHEFIINGKFKNTGIFKVMEITLVKHN